MRAVTNYSGVFNYCQSLITPQTMTDSVPVCSTMASFYQNCINLEVPLFPVSAPLCTLASTICNNCPKIRKVQLLYFCLVNII